MIVGILSDTHGNAPRTATAAALLLANQVEAVCHCGDVGGKAVLAELAAAFDPEQIPVYCVPGNIDWEPDLRRDSHHTRIRLLNRFAEIRLGGKRVALLHGHDVPRLRHARTSNTYDYVLTGHTHQFADDRIGKTRVINPGAVHRASGPTVAVLDTTRDEVRFIPLLDGEPA